MAQGFNSQVIAKSLVLDLRNTLQFLIAASGNVFILNHHFTCFQTFFRKLDGDVDKHKQWYGANQKLTFLLSTIIRKFLLLVTTNLCAVELVISDQGIQRLTPEVQRTLLKKAVILLQVNQTRREVDKLWSELKNLVMTTSLSERLYRFLQTSMPGEILFLTLTNDFQEVTKKFHQVFNELITKIEDQEINQVATKCLMKVVIDLDDRTPRYEIFEDCDFAIGSSMLITQLLSKGPSFQAQATSKVSIRRFGSKFMNKPRKKTSRKLKAKSLGATTSSSAAITSKKSIGVNPSSSSEAAGINPELKRLLSPENLQTWRILESVRKGGFGDLYHASVEGYANKYCFHKVPIDNLDILTTNGKLLLASELSRSFHGTCDGLIHTLDFTMHKQALYVAVDEIGISLLDFLHNDEDSASIQRLKTAGAKALSVNASMSKDSLAKTKSQIDRSQALIFSEIFLVISEVTKAVTFLHSRGLVHGDIRPENIFLFVQEEGGASKPGSDRVLNVRLANFNYGLTTIEPHWQGACEGGFEYQAPEILTSGSFSTASDIYSLAICLWEMSQRKRLPYDHFPDKKDLVLAIKGGERPRFTEIRVREGMNFREPSWLIELTKTSWVPNPWDRPTAVKWASFFQRVQTKRAIDVKAISAHLAKEVCNRDVARTVTERPSRKLKSLCDDSSYMNMKSFTGGASERSLSLNSQAWVGQSKSTPARLNLETIRRYGLQSMKSSNTSKRT